MEDLLFFALLVIIAEGAFILVFWSDKQQLKRSLAIEQETNEIMRKFFARFTSPQVRDNIVPFRGKR